MEIVNIAAYKFVGIPDAASWRPIVKERCEQIGVMGNILLSQEGINLFVAGERGPVDQFLQYLKGDPFFAGRFSDIPVKESISDHQPFRRIVVRVKDEIITMKHPMIDPTAERAPAVEPKTLK
ncbi:MAG: sulfurtransferase, partial [Cyanobacteria bacterium PR.023]|nr:sulfurtransferase [Cyanobacteria bacterium PR.023]